MVNELVDASIRQLSPLVARRRVARWFRVMRMEAGLSLDEAAAKLDMTRSGLHRMETAVAIPHVHIARSMMDLYDQYSPEMLDTIRAARQRGWWQGCRAPNREYLGWEAGAAILREVAVVRVPELLQTEDYAHVALAGREQYADQISARRIRKKRLTDPDWPLTVMAVLDEASLRNRQGSPMVMRDQLAHVVAMAERPNVRVRVLPASADVRDRIAGFRLLDFAHPDDSPILYADSVHATIRADRPEEIAEASRVFDALDAAALSEQDSLALIQRVNDELYAT